MEKILDYFKNNYPEFKTYKEITKIKINGKEINFGNKKDNATLP